MGKIPNVVWLVTTVGVGLVGIAVDRAVLTRWGEPQPAARNLAAYGPTPVSVVEQGLRLAQVGPQDIVYDLGSGDGRILTVAAQKFGANALGIELNYFLVQKSRAEIKRVGLEKVIEVRWGDINGEDLSSATVVTMALTEEANTLLAPKLERELLPGTRVVCYFWPIKAWKPVRIESFRDPDVPTRVSVLYLYQR